MIPATLERYISNNCRHGRIVKEIFKLHHCEAAEGGGFVVGILIVEDCRGLSASGADPAARHPSWTTLGQTLL